MSATDNILSGLTPNEVKLLALTAVCLPGKMDFDQLASITGIKKTSASAMWSRAKAKLERAVGEDAVLTESPTKATKAPKAKGTPRGRKKTTKPETIEQPVVENEMDADTNEVDE